MRTTGRDRLVSLLVRTKRLRTASKHAEFPPALLICVVTGMLKAKKKQNHEILWQTLR